MTDNDRVVVTGLGAVTPIGNSVPEFWDNLRGGVSGVGPISLFDTSSVPVKMAAEVKAFEPRAVTAYCTGLESVIDGASAHELVDGHSRGSGFARRLRGWRRRIE